MDKNALREVGQKMRALLEAYGIQADAIEMNIVVPESYYRGIEAGFPERKSSEMRVGVSKDNWVISILSTSTAKR